jgi:hypothetical protein
MFKFKTTNDDLVASARNQTFYSLRLWQPISLFCFATATHWRTIVTTTFLVARTNNTDHHEYKSENRD